MPTRPAVGTELDVRLLPAGVYLLELRTELGKSAQRRSRNAG
jgi:hypothetical protein